MDEKGILDISNIVEDLKNLLDSLSNKFSFIQLKKENSIEDLVRIYSNHKEFINKLDLIKKLTDDMADNLERLDSFEEEFYIFLSARNMINYIIGNIEYYILYSSFVHELSSLFCNLINTKITHLRNSTINDYENEFSLFKKNFFEKKQCCQAKIF